MAVDILGCIKSGRGTASSAANRPASHAIPSSEQTPQQIAGHGHQHPGNQRSRRPFPIDFFFTRGRRDDISTATGGNFTAPIRRQELGPRSRDAPCVRARHTNGEGLEISFAVTSDQLVSLIKRNTFSAKR